MLREGLIAKLACLGALALLSTAHAVDKSGVTPNTVSLPSGPGSVEGLGDAFQPTLNTGTASHGIAIAVPAGTRGMAPSVALRYEGGSGNGPLGYGWSMPLPFVQRQTAKGIPRYVDGPDGRDDNLDGEIDDPEELDIFINEVKEELVPLEDPAGGTIDWFCENENLFARYRRVGEHWEATLPEGTRIVFGESSSARLVDGERPDRIFRWLVERIVDTHGITVHFEYRRFPGRADLNQVYCSRITYGPGGPPWTSYHFVHFDYETRPDRFEDGRAGFAIRTARRLKTITVGTQAPGLALVGHARDDYDGDGTQDALVRRYRLDYAADSHWSLLESVTVVGADDSSTLPPARFGYTRCRHDPVLSARDRIVDSSGLAVAFDSELVDLVDLNGDGLPDMLRTFPGGGAHLVSINAGQVEAPGGPELRWNRPREVAVPAEDPGAWNVELSNESVSLSDMDGDGLADLVTAGRFNSFFYRNDPGQPGADDSGIAWSERRRVFTPNEAPPSPFAFPDVRTADIDFDKRTDIIRSVAIGPGRRVSYQIWFNIDGERYSDRLTVTPSTGYPFDDPAVHIADFNGDRVPDVAWIRSASIHVTTGLGHGDFLDERVVAIPDRLLEPEQVGRAHLEDVTGDGLVDLVVERAVAGELWFWVNLGNFTLDSRRRVTGMPTVLGQSPEVRFADLNGNGTTDVIYASRQVTPTLRMVDIGQLMGCAPRPHLLNYVENGIGRVTRVEYRTSVDFALEAGRDGPGGEYVYRGSHPVPFPVELVSRVVTEDTLGGVYESRFEYLDGFYDPREKQFRGFARVAQTDLGDQSAPTLVTRSQFLTGTPDPGTGANLELLKGKLVSVSAETADGELFFRESTDWTIRQLFPERHPTPDGRLVRLAHVASTEREILERGVGVPRTVRTEFEVDDYGNQVEVRELGIVGNEAEPDVSPDERTTRTTHALDLDGWLLRFPSRVEVSDGEGNLISRQETFYDDPDFSGTNAGIVTRGDATLVRAWIDPDDDDAFVNSLRTRYDVDQGDFGNPVEIFDALADPDDLAAGHARSILWDETFQTAPVAELVHPGDGKEPFVVEVEYDLAFGIVLEATGFNGHTTRYLHDAFARPTGVVRPLDDDGQPSIEYEYGLAVPFGGGLINYVERRSLDRPEASGRERFHISRSYVDGLGRGLQTREEAEPDPATGQARVVVSGASVFNRRMQVGQPLQPFYSLVGASNLDGLLEYENIEADGWTGLFHEDGELVELDLDSAHGSRLFYDATLRPIETVNPDGTRSRVAYEPLVTRSFDENDSDPASPYFGTPMAHHVDGLGRLIRVDEIVRLDDEGRPTAGLNTWTTRYAYRADDAITRLVDSRGNIKRVGWDGLGRRVRMDDPDRGTTMLEYDEVSNLVAMLDAKGQLTTFVYDGVNRLIEEDFEDDSSPEFSYGRSPDIRYVYDTPSPDVDFGGEAPRNLLGFLSWVDDASGEEHSSYDERGRPEWELKRIRDPASGALADYRTAMRYDRLDRGIEVIYPDGDRLAYEYDARASLERIVHAGGRAILRGIEQTPAGQLLSIAHGNGVTTEQAYDARLRLTDVFTARERDRVQPLIAYRYEFDPVSNITRIDDLRPASAGLSAVDARRNTQVFGYDDLYRITSVAYPDSPRDGQGNERRVDYRYDPIGNMLEKASAIEQLDSVTGLPVANIGVMSYGGGAGTSGRNGRLAGDPPGPHALTSTSTGRVYPYDDNGNMTSIDGLEITWDFRDRQVIAERSAPEVMRAEYRYDSSGRRVTKSVETDGQPVRTTTYVNRYYEVRDDGSTVKYFYSGDTRVARLKADGRSERTQHFPVVRGWNLFSMVVDAADAAGQLGLGASPAVDELVALVRWARDAGEWREVEEGEALPPGTIFWVLASAPGLLEVTGQYVDPGDESLDLSPGDYVPVRRLEGVCVDDLVTSRPTEIWTFSKELQIWQLFHAAEFPFLGDASERLEAGTAFFAEAADEFSLWIRGPPPPVRIEYYHQDHLGSSNIIADGEGNIVDETSFYPFGHTRNEFSAPSAERLDAAPYLFTQKERDEESGLHYFEARYYADTLGRFTRVDPLGFEEQIEIARVPQALNLYAYTRSRPLYATDPTGLQGQECQRQQMLDDEVEAEVIALEGRAPGTARAVSARQAVNQRMANRAYLIADRDLITAFRQQVRANPATTTFGTEADVNNLIAALGQSNNEPGRDRIRIQDIARLIPPNTADSFGGDAIFAAAEGVEFVLTGTVGGVVFNFTIRAHVRDLRRAGQVIDGMIENAGSGPVLRVERIEPGARPNRVRLLSLRDGNNNLRQGNRGGFVRINTGGRDRQNYLANATHPRLEQ